MAQNEPLHFENIDADFLEDGMEPVIRHEAESAGSLGKLVEGMKTLRMVPVPAVTGAGISQIVTNRLYVASSVLILDLADDLSKDDSVYAVGVTDEEDNVEGILVRRDLFTLIGRPFGRDILRKQNVQSVISKTRVFRCDENIFSVGESIDMETQDQGITYYLLVDDRGKFSGMFSSKDMLIFLSNITKQDISLARRIQMRIVREFESHASDSYELVCSAQMAKGVGGDFYAVKPYGDGRLMLSVCDVSGKGMAASLVSSVLSGVINTYDFRRGLPNFLIALNAFLTNTFEHEKFVTGMFLDFDSRSSTIGVWDMGHSHLYLFRSGRCLHVQGPASNLPLGISDEMVPAGYRFSMKEGDLLFLVSDGLLEQRNANGMEYSPERVGLLLGRNPNVGLESLKVLILEDFHSFRGVVPLHDDVTLLLLKTIGRKADSDSSGANSKLP